MITLSKKKTFGDWIELEDGIKMKIDYPTRAQERELLNFLIGEESKELITPAKLDYMRYFLKYTIKDWKGIKDEDGNEIPCRLKNNELDTELWEDLIANLDQSINLWVKINSELEFDVYDKKKLHTPKDSKEK